MATIDFNAPIWHGKKNQKYCDDATHEGNNLFKNFVFRYGEAISLKIARGQMYISETEGIGYTLFFTTVPCQQGDSPRNYTKIKLKFYRPQDFVSLLLDHNEQGRLDVYFYEDSPDGDPIEHREIPQEDIMKQEVNCNKDETGKTIGEVVISSQATENNLYKIVYYRQEDLPKLILLIFIIGIIFGGLGLGLGWWLL